MDKKCNKYEAIFTFGTQEDLLNHIAQCPECAKEHEKMQKISSLVQEVRTHYSKKQKTNQVLKIVCTLLFLVFGSAAFVLNSNDLTDTIKYGTTLSAQDLGFPVDSYGLIMVE